MTSNLVKSILLTILFGQLLNCVGTASFAERPNYHAEALAERLRLGSMSEANFNKMDGIEDNIERRGTVSDAELTWAIKLLKEPPVKNTSQARSDLTAVIVFRLLEAKSFTADQKYVLNQAATWLTSSDLWVNRSWGLAIFLRTGDRAALPIARRLASDPNQLVGPRARYFLIKYGGTTARN